MAENLAQRLHDNFLQCSICSEKLNDPRMLPCVHTFCLRCLVRWEDSLRGQDFRCPFCQANVELPEGGVRGLPANFILVNLMEELQLAESRPDGVSPVCGFCTREDGKLFCLDCKLYLCISCEETHKRLPGFNDHTIIGADKLADQGYMKKVIATKPPKCTEHTRENIQFYCRACQSLACLHCTVVNHNGHECVDVKKEASAVTREMDRLLEQGENQTEVFLKIMNDLSDTMTEKRANIAECKRQIEDHFEEFVARLHSDRNKLLREIERFEEDHCEPIKSTSDNVKEWLQQMENTRTQVRRTLGNDNPWEILKMKKDYPLQFEKMTESGGKLCREEIDCQKNAMERVYFSATKLDVPAREENKQDQKVHPEGNMVGHTSRRTPWISRFLRKKVESKWKWFEERWLLPKGL